MNCTKMNFSIKDFSSKCDQIRSFHSFGISEVIPKPLKRYFEFSIAFYSDSHCVKSVRIRMRENTDRITPNMDTFHAVSPSNVFSVGWLHIAWLNIY